MRLLRFISAASFLVSLVAHADTLYTSAAAYAAAASTSTTINFNGVAPAGGFVQESTPFSLSGSTFTFSATSTAFIVDPGFYSSTYAGGGFLTVDYTAPADLLTVSLPSVTAISFLYGGLLGATNPFTVTLSDGFTTTFSTTNSIQGTNSLAFLGLTSSTPITSISFTLPDTPNYNALDNLSYGQATATAVTPEPSTFALLGTGLLAVAGVVKRRYA